MNETPNKIKYGLKNVHYAKATIAEDGSATYATPVKWPGAVNLSMSAEGETNQFYADDVVYYTSVSNNGYSGTLESALVPESFAEDILDEIEDAKGVMLEVVEGEPVHFALLFEFAGDQKRMRHILYNCVAARPDVASATKETSIEPQTETVDLSASSIYVSSLDKNVVKARSCSKTDATEYENWYKAVYLPTKKV